MNKTEKDKIRIGILRGGDEEFYTSSLQKGGEIISFILNNLSHKYKPFDVFVDKEGQWHLNGVPIEPIKLLYKVDLVWNLSHQRFSNILESYSIRNIGIPAFSPFFGINIDKFQEKIKKLGLKMPRNLVLPLYQEDFDGSKEKYALKKAKEIFEKFSSPWIVKSFTPDSNMGVHLAKTFPELVSAILDGVEHKKSILVEEFIAGKIASIHSVPDFRKQDIYIFPFGNTFGTFSSPEKEKLINIAKNLHTNMGIKHYLKLDFILDKKGKVYLLNIDLTPDLKRDSHFGEVCESVGAKIPHILEHIFDKSLL